MLTVKGEHYYNDFTRSNFEKRFYNLDEIFNWLAAVSENFTSKWGNYFPRISEHDVSRISACDEHNRGWEYWIYHIENENGIVFSTGKYTAGQKFCAEQVKEWCIECGQRIDAIRNKPNFVEM